MGLYKRKELRATFASSLAVIAMLLASPLLASPVQAEIISYEGQHSDDRLGLHSSGASNWSVDEDSMSLCGMGDTDSYPTTKSRSEPPQRSQNVKQNIHKAKVRGYGLPSHVLYAGVLATAFVGVKNGMGWWDGRVSYTERGVFPVTPPITAPVPEPNTLLLMGVGMGVVLGAARRRKKTNSYMS